MNNPVLSVVFPVCQTLCEATSSSTLSAHEAFWSLKQHGHFSALKCDGAPSSSPGAHTLLNPALATGLQRQQQNKFHAAC